MPPMITHAVTVLMCISVANIENYQSKVEVKDCTLAYSFSIMLMGDYDS